MSDEIDQTDERSAVFDAARIAAVRAKAVIVPGTPGDCEICGEWSGRLVGAACAPCRDRFELP